MYCRFTRDESDDELSGILKTKFAAFNKLLEETIVDDMCNLFTFIFGSPRGFIRVQEILTEIHSKHTKFTVQGILA